MRKVSIKSYLLASVSSLPLWWAGMLFPAKAVEDPDNITVTVS